ncbi:MAG: biotin--[acetyl-CoA-carboxylase] ligase [Desulfurococcaceae archaeon]
MDKDILSSIYVKLEILRTLSTRERANISRLAAELGIQEDDLRGIIEDLSKNYMIKLERDSIIWQAGDNPAWLKPWGWNYTYKILVGSTMIVAKRSPPWTLVVAEHQLKGYGRHLKQWISNLGGLWASYNIELTPSLVQLLPIVIPTLICLYLRERWGFQAEIKWPNDIVYRQKKLAGIILEGEVYGGRVLATIGIGMNVNNEPPLETATSLKLIVDKLVPRNSIIAQITGFFGKLEVYAENHRKIQSLYIDLLDTLGKKVRAYTVKGEVVRGIAKSITETGDLVVESDTGTVKLSSNEVFELRYEE